VASYSGRIDAIPRRHLQFIERCAPYFETEQHFFVHANYAADLPLDEQPDDLRYWIHLTRTLPSPHQSGKVAVVGHTPQIAGRILDLGHLLCIDTFCFGGAWLTALEVNTRQLWQASEAGKTRQERREA
jgi:serine/threonine protein phosphatase 1